MGDMQMIDLLPFVKLGRKTKGVKMIGLTITE